MLKNPFKPLSRDDFAEHIVRLAREQGSSPLEYDPTEFRLRQPGGNGVTVNLGNAYEAYRAAPLWNRQSVIRRFLNVFTAVDEPLVATLEAARDHLYPLVRERFRSEHFRLSAIKDRGTSSELTNRIFAEHLVLEVGYDLPTSIRSLNTDTLADWGLTFDDALAIASDNLRRIPPRFQSPRPGLYISDWNDGYDASRLHLIGMIADLRVTGRPVAMVPNRDRLIVTGANDPEGLVQMAKLAEPALDAQRSMVGAAFRLDGSWNPFLPDPDHPAYNHFKRLTYQSLHNFYEEQQRLLEAIYEREHKDHFVASYQVVQNPKTTKLGSIALWSEGMPTSLPEVDYVCITKADASTPKQPLGFTPWQVIKDTIGPRMTAEENYPPRYTMPSYLTKEETRELISRTQENPFE